MRVYLEKFLEVFNTVNKTVVLFSVFITIVILLLTKHITPPEFSQITQSIVTAYLGVTSVEHALTFGREWLTNRTDINSKNPSITPPETK